MDSFEPRPGDESDNGDVIAAWVLYAVLAVLLLTLG